MAIPGHSALQPGAPPAWQPGAHAAWQQVLQIWVQVLHSGGPDWLCWAHTGLHCGGSDKAADACGADECRAGALSLSQQLRIWCGIGIRAVWTGLSWNLC